MNYQTQVIVNLILYSQFFIIYICILKKFFEENDSKYKILSFSLETNKPDLKEINKILINNNYVEVFNPYLKGIKYKNKQVDWEKYYIHKDISQITLKSIKFKKLLHIYY